MGTNSMKTKARSVLVFCTLLAVTFFARAAETPPIPKLRLDDIVRPLGYTAELVVVPNRSNFTGQIAIELEFKQPSDFFWLHGHGLTVTNAHLEQKGRSIAAEAVPGGEEFLGFRLHQQAAAGKA